MLEDFVYFNKTAFSSLSLCFTLGFRDKKLVNIYSKKGETNHYKLYFSNNPSYFYVKLVIITNTREFNFLYIQICTFYSVK